MMSVYSRSLPLLSFHFLYITEASTLAGEKVLGSLRSEMTLSRMVLGERGVSGCRVLSGHTIPQGAGPSARAFVRIPRGQQLPRGPPGPQPCRRHLVLLVFISGL